MRYALASISSKEGGGYSLHMRGKKPQNIEVGKNYQDSNLSSLIDIMTIVGVWQDERQYQKNPSSIISDVESDISDKNSIVRISATDTRQIVVADDNQEMLLDMDDGTEAELEYVISLILKQLSNAETIKIAKLRKQVYARNAKNNRLRAISQNKLPI